MLRSFAKKFKKPSTIKLGRWDTKNTFQTNDEIKAVWNSADHCGDQICGNPSLVKELIYNNNDKDNDNDFCCQLMGLHSCGSCNLLK